MCSPAVYRRGERTLAFLRRRTADGSLQDGACSGSRFAKSVPEQLEYVRAYFSGRTRTTIKGRIAANTSDHSVAYELASPDGTPVEAAQVAVEGNGRRFSTNTNNRGEYAFEGIPPGSYSVNADKEGYSSEQSDGKERTSFAVNVNPGNCAIQDFSLWTRNSLQGTVRDSAGKPVAGINVFLQKVNGEKDRYGEEAKTNRDGQFQFKRIDPRPQYLVVSPFGPEPDSPYETRFYGGAETRERAQVLNIDANSELYSRDLILGNRIPTRTIRVRPEWPDRQLISDAFVRCRDATKTDDRGLDSTAVRENGFICAALSDRAYRVELGGLGINMVPKHTAGVVVPAGTQDATVTIRVSLQDAASSIVPRIPPLPFQVWVALGVLVAVIALPLIAIALVFRKLYRHSKLSR
jgi:hypothetical protein